MGHILWVRGSLDSSWQRMWWGFLVVLGVSIMAFVNHAWITGSLDKDKLLKVRVSLDDMARLVFEPIVEYEVVDVAQGSKLLAGHLPLASHDPERLLNCLKERKSNAEEDRRVVVCIHEVAFDMVYRWLKESGVTDEQYEASSGSLIDYKSKFYQ